jgi:hypothetical protein
VLQAIGRAEGIGIGVGSGVVLKTEVLLVTDFLLAPVELEIDVGRREEDNWPMPLKPTFSML